MEVKLNFCETYWVCTGCGGTEVTTLVHIDRIKCLDCGNPMMYATACRRSLLHGPGGPRTLRDGWDLLMEAQKDGTIEPEG